MEWGTGDPLNKFKNTLNLLCDSELCVALRYIVPTDTRVAHITVSRIEAVGIFPIAYRQS